MNRFIRSESGNVFTMVLIGVVLFGALAYSFMRSGRQGATNVSAQQASIAAGDVLAYARNIEQGISRLRTKGISESDIDFVGADAAYNNADCVDPECEVFNPAGGRQVWQTTIPSANDGSPWAFTGSVSVDEVGRDDGDPKASELLMVLPNVDVAVCRDINARLGVENPADSPPSAAGAIDISVKYTGTFTAGSTLGAAALDGKQAACYEDGGDYFFYQVLLAR